MTCCTYECTGAKGCPVRETPAGICGKPQLIQASQIPFIPVHIEHPEPERNYPLWVISASFLAGLFSGVVVVSIFRVGV